MPQMLIVAAVVALGVTLWRKWEDLMTWFRNMPQMLSDWWHGIENEQDRKDKEIVDEMNEGGGAASDPTKFFDKDWWFWMGKSEIRRENIGEVSTSDLVSLLNREGDDLRDSDKGFILQEIDKRIAEKKGIDDQPIPDDVIARRDAYIAEEEERIRGQWEAGQEALERFHNQNHYNQIMGINYERKPYNPKTTWYRQDPATWQAEYETVGN